MATGGMGDALTGICGAFLARGMDPFWAAAAGAWVHGTAGDLALERRGGESLVASEVIQALPAALDEIRRCRVP
jgi:NAD(P)H-hydrate epimerase